MSDDELTTLASHLSQCAKCQETLATAAFSDDTVVAILRQPAAADPYEHEPAYRRGLAQVQAISSPRSGPSAEAGQDPLAGKNQLGVYSLLEPLGSGGMGVVYKAVHTRLRKTVALKVLSSRALARPDALNRFRREMQAVGVLDHPHIVRALDAGEADGVRYLAMELLAGEDLHSRVKRQGPLTVDEARSIVVQTARGLAVAHSRGVIHRDVKPSNLFLTLEGNVKILDLGLARLEARDGPAALHEPLTCSGLILGSVDFLAPEQALDGRAADARSDIYSLGCTLYYLLTGQPLHGGDTIVKKLLAHREARTPSLRQRRPDVSRALEAVFLRMLARDPARRFPDMESVVAALEDSARMGRDALARFRPHLISAASLLVMIGAALLLALALPHEAHVEPMDPPPVTVFTGHTHMAISLALSPDERRLVCGSGHLWQDDKMRTDGVDFCARVWNIDNPWPVLRLGDHNNVVNAVAFSADGQRILSADWHGVVNTYDGDSGERLAVFQQKECRGHHAAQFSADARYILFGGTDSVLRLCDTATGEVVWRLSDGNEILATMAISPDGRYVLSGGGGIWYSANYQPGSDFVIRLWDTSTGSVVGRLEGHTNQVRGLAFSPDATRALSTAMDGTLRLWDLASGQQLQQFNHETEVVALAFSPDGQRALSGGRDGLRLWDLETGEQLDYLVGHSELVRRVLFTRDGRTAYSSSYDGSVRRWSLP
jgi:serine/threonine protein kinase